MVGISLLKESSPRVKGRVMAHGELFSTLMGIQILKVHFFTLLFVSKGLNRKNYAYLATYIGKRMT